VTRLSVHAYEREGPDVDRKLPIHCSVLAITRYEGTTATKPVGVIQPKVMLDAAMVVSAFVWTCLK